MPSDNARYLALGDSYTVGEGVAEHERWPNQLVDLLRNIGSRAVGKPEIIAQTGWTSGELLDAIRRSEATGPYALVSLLVGVNNQYRGLSIDQFQEELRQLLQTAVAFAAGAPERVIVLSIPDWGVTPFAEGRDRGRIASELDQFNDTVRTEAERFRTHFVDVTGISRDAAAHPDLVAADGLHPSGKMYGKWAEAALPIARAALAPPAAD